jgi:hypothetical protein
MQQIFISYAQDQSHGQHLAEQVQQQLHGAGFVVFRDVSGIAPGTKWAHEIERQLKASKLVVLVVSAKALHSEWVFAECDMAKEHGIPIIPVFAESLSSPLWLRSLQRLDFSHQPDWQRLMQAIGVYISLPVNSECRQSPLPVSLVSTSMQPQPTWAAVMSDDDYGRYADLNVDGVIQRFRWIKRGKFLMGSPESEAGRSENETQHEVALTRNFWLADTACTQALWQVVTKNNPARFQDDHNNPVEMVGWDDAQKFAIELNNLIEGLHVRLPTEAEWEYACRTKIYAPFNFGADITLGQVNYGGNDLELTDQKMPYRQRTVPVKFFPANPWGLYEMHGNVSEWCQDRLGEYPTSLVVDPENLNSGSVCRVLRGGSWKSVKRVVRSAHREGFTTVYRRSHVGFRLAISDRTLHTENVWSRGDKVFIYQGPFRGLDAIFQRYDEEGLAIVSLDILYSKSDLKILVDMLMDV